MYAAAAGGLPGAGSAASYAGRIHSLVPSRAVAAAVVAAVGLSGCGGTGGGTPATPSTASREEACGRVTVDDLDPRSTQHLLPGAPAPTYATDPPTSGPHVAGADVSGVQARPLEGPVQVAVLEEGGVMLQYRPDLPKPAVEELASLAGDDVVVAPNPRLAQPVVATAWRHRLACRSTDLSALRSFISERRGRGPG